MSLFDQYANWSPAREVAIRDAVQAGGAEYAWCTITSTHGEHTAEFSVFADALKIDGIRVNVTAETEQVIADMLDCMLLTPKLADLRWAQRSVSLPPFPGSTIGMSSTKAMKDHSAKIDAALAKMSGPDGIIETTGKHWVIDNALDGKFIGKVPAAMNYGWHFAPGMWKGYSEACASGMKHPDGTVIRLIQGRGTRHDINHTDYSQLCVLVHQLCTVDGAEMKLPEVLTNPDLAPLASHQGVLRVLRQPGV